MLEFLNVQRKYVKNLIAEKVVPFWIDERLIGGSQQKIFYLVFIQRADKLVLK